LFHKQFSSLNPVSISQLVTPSFLSLFLFTQLPPVTLMPQQKKYICWQKRKLTKSKKLQLEERYTQEKKKKGTP
jgi:hypothetical protein